MRLSEKENQARALAFKWLTHVRDGGVVKSSDGTTILYTYSGDELEVLECCARDLLIELDLSLPERVIA